jgi:acetyl esterase/lipase
MRRFRASVFALALAVVLVGAAPMPRGAQAMPRRPTQPTSGPGGSEELFSGLTRIEQPDPNQPGADYWLFVPSDPLPGVSAPDGPFPLVVFIPGKMLGDPEPYLAWIEHLVRRGAVVLFPDWQGTTTDADEPAYRQHLLADVGNALGTLEQEGVLIDPNRVAVVGHSVGGVLAVDYAASAAAAGLPVPAAVMGVSPSCTTEEVACLGADLGIIPPTTRVLLVTMADDPGSTGPAAVERMWSGLGMVPPENRDIVTLITDGHGKPSLLAVHLQALADYDLDKPDAFDWYGTWKWLDALMGCAFEGEWCEYALGNTPEQRFMGTWSDGVPVTEAEVTDATN